MAEKTIAFFLLFQGPSFVCNRLCVGTFQYVSSVVAAASIAIIPLAYFTPSPNTRIPLGEGVNQQLRFGVFREGVFQKMPALDGAISERNFCEIFRRKSPQNTETHTKQSSAQRFLNDPFPKTPFFSC